MTPSLVPVMRSVKPWRNAAFLLAMAACVPVEPPVAPAPAPAPPARPVEAPPAPVAPPPSIPASVSTLATPVRVGLLVDTSTVEVGADGRFEVASESGERIARLEAGQTARFTLDGGSVTLETRGAGAAGRVQRGLRAPLVVQSAGEAILRVGTNPYRGVLRVQEAPRGGLTLVNQLDMESYLLGVVPREIGRVGPELLEASKAQAVAARTYAVRYLGRRAAQGFDVFATVDDQVYGGVTAEHAPVSRAVLETVGEILEYRGQPILAYYHSTCAGRTAAINEVWNEQASPYLVSVVDVNRETGEAFDRSSSRFTWTERWTGAQMIAVLNRTLADSLGGRRITDIREMRVLSRTESGRVRAMRIVTDAGSVTVGKDRVRWILPPMRGGILNSSKFDVRLVRSGGALSEVVIEGGGWGHGIGMCQVGAMGRARAGQDYRAILSAYYPGTEIRDLY
ncbi:MAG TPA: SpoIID/LytB domain-containing protein [Longimicrobium sp.]|nr:SpoIID/LytB domain-containing protein [Longimicrobium sp.]